MPGGPYLPVHLQLIRAAHNVGLYRSGARCTSSGIARRHGDAWYLGSLTNWTARDLSIDLGFLGQGKYEAELYEDAPDAAQNPKHVSIRRQNVRSSDTLLLHLASGGGCVIRFVPAKG